MPDAAKSAELARLPELIAAHPSLTAFGPDAVRRLSTHARLLAEWSGRMNLVGLKDAGRAVEELYADSARLLPAIEPTTGPVVDLGSGAGFPGLVLAALRPQREFILVDSNGKKCSFLAAAIPAMGLPRVNMIQARLEEFGRMGKRGRCGAAVSKAFGPWAVGLELAMPLIQPGGRVAFFAGSEPPAPAEIQPVVDLLGGGTVEVTPYRLTGAESDRHIVTVTKTGFTADLYPRAVGVPDKRPLRGGSRE
jgi:16S rRNA (guanine527-N7)-methyltransferase